MDREKLEKLQDRMGAELESKLHEAQKKTEEVIIPLGEFSEVTKARNEQEKQVNEKLHWETEWRKAELDAKIAADRMAIDKHIAEVEAELAKERLSFEREKLEAEQRMADEKNASDEIVARIEQETAEQKSKWEMFMTVIETVAKIVVNVLILAVSIIQVKGISRAEENDTYVRSDSIKFWNRPKNS